MEINGPGFIREPGFPHQLQQVRIGTHPESNISRFSLIDTMDRQIRLPKEKISQAVQEAQKLLEAQQASARQLAHLIGVFSSILPATLHYRGLQLLKHQALKKGGYNVILPLSQEAKDDLMGWGAVCQEEQIDWMVEEKALHINCLELLGATYAIQGQTRPGSPCAHGQHHGCSMSIIWEEQSHQALFHDKEPVGLVSSATFNHSCIPYPREAERGSRPTIKVNCGPSRLDAGSNNIPSNQFSFGVLFRWTCLRPGLPNSFHVFSVGNQTH